MANVDTIIDQVETDLLEAIRQGQYPVSDNLSFYRTDTDLTGDDGRGPILNVFDAGEEEPVVETDADGNIFMRTMLICRGAVFATSAAEASGELVKLESTVKRYWLGNPTMPAAVRSTRWIRVVERAVLDLPNKYLAFFVHEVRALYVTTPTTA